MDLQSFYNDLKSEKNRLDGGIAPNIHTGNLNTKLGVAEWKRKASEVSKRLSDDCAKHMILDIYCKILPLDDDFICGNMGMMKSDVDNMLADKNMSATQYLQSCANNTKAPMCEYVLNMCNLIGKQFLEKETERLKDANKNNMDIPTSDQPDVETDEEISNQLIDIKEDPSYITFIDKLKAKTIDKIVSDVSKIITDKKKDKEMAFDPKDSIPETESVIEIAVNHIQSRLMKESVDCGLIMDPIMGLAIRESTINIMNECFKMPNSDPKSFRSRMQYGKGCVITESAVSSLIEEACKSADEVNKVVSEADKKKNEEIDSKLKASDVVNADDDKDDDKDKKED